MVEDRVIAEHLTALLTPIIKSQSRCRSRIRTERENSDTSFDGGGGLKVIVAGCTWGDRIRSITRNVR